MIGLPRSLGSGPPADRVGQLWFAAPKKKKKKDEINLPCQTYEHGSQTAVIIVGFLQGSGDILADRLIVHGLTHVLGR